MRAPSWLAVENVTMFHMAGFIDMQQERYVIQKNKKLARKDSNKWKRSFKSKGFNVQQ